MKKITFLPIILFSIFSTYAVAQKNIDLPHYKFSENTVAYSDYLADTKETIITYLNGNKLEAILLDKELNNLKDSISYKLPGSGYYIEKMMCNSSNINYIIANKDGDMRILNYEKSSKNWALGNNIRKEGERLLTSVSYKNKFYLFNYERKSGVIKVYTADISGLSSFKDYNLNNFKVGGNDLNYFLKKKKKAFKTITSESPNELFASRKAKKMYQFNEKVYLTIDDSTTKSSSLIQFDLKTKKHAITYFKTNPESCDSSQYIKSAVTKNYLTTISGCLKKATIDIWDLKTNKKIQTTSLIDKELITIKNYDNLISPKKAHSIEVLKSQVLLRQLMKGSAAIYLRELPNNLELLVGRLSIKPKKNKLKKNSQGNGDGTGGGRQQKLDRQENRKIKGLGLSKSYLNYEACRAQFFVSNLELSTKKFNPNAAYTNIFEKVRTYKLENGIGNDKSQFLLSRDNKFWFGHINNTSKKLTLIEIN